MMCLVNNNQSRRNLHLSPVTRQPLDRHHLHPSVLFSHSVAGNGVFNLLHQFPAVRHNPYPATGTTQELPHYGSQQVCLSRACRHLYHHTPVKLPLFKESELHLLLVVTKTIVLAIHYTDASRYRQQKQGRPHTLSHTAYSKYSIFINLFYRRL